MSTTGVYALRDTVSKALSLLHKSVIVDDKVVQDSVQCLVMGLLKADVPAALVKPIRENILKHVRLADPKTNKRKLIEKLLAQELLHMISGQKEDVTPAAASFKPIRGRCSVVLFVGLQGAGKTTSCTKYARYYQRQGLTTGLVCADTFRAGAFDQLAQNATKCRIPYYGSHSEQDPVAVATQGIAVFRKSKTDLIVVDSSGRHKQSDELALELQELVHVTQPDHIVLAVDASGGQSVMDQCRAFSKMVTLGSILMTKTDGHAKGGGALAAVAATGCRIAFIGTGESLDALEPFRPESFVARVLGRGDVVGLMVMMEEHKEAFESSAVAQKLSSGVGDFTFADMQQQLQQTMSMGPVTQILEKLPGMSQFLDGKNKSNKKPEDVNQVFQNKMKRWLVMMDSMTSQELNGDTTLFKSQTRRTLRVALGSGCTVEQVNELLKAFPVLKTQFKAMQKLQQSGGFNNDDIGKDADPNQVLQNVLQTVSGGGGRNRGRNTAQLQSLLKKQFGGKLPANLASMLR